MNRLSILILIVLSFIGPSSMATEPDNISHRDIKQDATAWLNSMMNLALQDSIRDLPPWASAHVIHQRLFKNLGGLFFAEIEKWSAANGSPAELIPIEKSIFRDVGDVKPKENLLRKLVPFNKYYTPGNFRINDVVFGDDKLGHFLQVGYIMYFAAKRKVDPQFKDARPLHVRLADKVTGDEKFRDRSRLQGVALAYAYGRYMEDNQWGMKATMARSYGDLAANIEGFLFWSNLTEGDKPYLRLNEFGQWEQAKDFSWNKYVTPAWDEAVNRSDYHPLIKKQVEARIQQALGANCSSLPSCASVIEKFGTDSQHILNPRFFAPRCSGVL